VSLAVRQRRRWPLFRWFAARVRAWAETVLADDAPPEAGDAGDGPPAHWVEKVRHAAPELLTRPPGAPVPSVAGPPPQPLQVEQRTPDGDERAPDVEPAHGPAQERRCTRTVSATTPEPAGRRDEEPREGRVLALSLPKPGPSPSEPQPRPAAAEPASRDEDAPLSRAATHASSEDPPLFPDRQTRTFSSPGFRLPKSDPPSLPAGASWAVKQEPARDELPPLRQARPIPPRKDERSPYPAHAEPASVPARLRWVRPVTPSSSELPSFRSAEWPPRPEAPAWPELPRDERQDEPDVEDLLRELDRRARLAREQRGG